jgi:hypothetical protein
MPTPAGIVEVRMLLQPPFNEKTMFPKQLDVKKKVRAIDCSTAVFP